MRDMTYIVLKVPLNSNQPTNQPPQDVMSLNIVINLRRMAYAKVTVDLCNSSIKLRHTIR